jgi:ubiquitin-protein ligase
MRITEEWNSEEKEGQQAHWLGGVYLCKFPPSTGDTTIQIEIDITEEVCPVVWMIQTTADNLFYPGRHAGKLEFSLGFPMDQIYVVWLTPIFSPFVRFRGGRGDVSSPFDLGKWSPYYTVQHVLQTIANFLALDPLCRTPPPLNHGVVQVPWQFSDLSRVVSYALNEDAFFHAAQFFSRAYNRVGREVDDPPVLASQRQASVTAIKELVDFYLHGRPPVPEGRGSANYVAAFEAVRTNNEWIAEEKVWADALSVACRFEFFEP